MADKPILFSGPMVRAIIEGRKSQTRRVLKPQPLLSLRPCPDRGNPVATTGMGEIKYRPLPYASGDRLWVREAFTTTQHGKAVYRADATDQTGQRWGNIVPDDPAGEVRWRPSIHMPRLASRLTLTVTNVRVQRVQEIWGQDLRAEGLDIPPGPPLSPAECEYWRSQFAVLWDSLNAKRGFGWVANPWVAALAFDVHHGAAILKATGEQP